MPKLHIGFVSTRLAGTDGVTLETWKWVRVLEHWGHECFYFAGEIEAPQDRSWVVPEAHFQHPDIQRIQQDLFDDLRRDAATSRRIEQIKNHLKEQIHRFVKAYGIQVLIAENALSLPMNVPLGWP